MDKYSLSEINDHKNGNQYLAAYDKHTHIMHCKFVKNIAKNNEKNIEEINIEFDKTIFDFIFDNKNNINDITNCKWAIDKRTGFIMPARLCTKF